MCLEWGFFTLADCSNCGKHVYLNEADNQLYEPDPVDDCLSPHVCEGK